MSSQDHILLYQRTASVLRMGIPSLLSMLPVLTYGTVSAFQTIGLPKLLEPNGTGIIIDIHQMSWLCKNISQWFIRLRDFVSVTLNQPARVLGLFLSGAISDKIGRKKSLIAFSIFQIISSVAMYFVRSYESLMVTLCLSGLSMSMVMIPREHENILLIKIFKFCYDMNLTNNLYVSKYFHLSQVTLFSPRFAW